MSFVDDALALVYADPDATVPVVVGAANVRGFLDREPSQLTDAAGFAVESYSATLRLLAAGAPAIVEEQQITADGGEWVVRRIRRPGDARELELLLVEWAE